jgi:hypothetical protein
MNNFYNSLITKLQGIRYSAFPPKVLAFSAIYYFNGGYLNYKHDKFPLVFIMYSGPKYTHGLNIHYADDIDKQWLMRILVTLRRGNQAMDGLTFYRFLKLNRINIIKKCYRVYFTNQIRNTLLVSSGLTEMIGLVKPFDDFFIKSLNNQIEERNLLSTQKTAPAFSQEELYSKVNEVFNTVPLERQRAVTGVQTKGLAPWYTNPLWNK